MKRRIAALLALAVASGTAAAQLPRGRVFGRVRSAGKAAWENARVFLFARSIPSNEIAGSADLVETQTDARGRFAAKILRGRPYTVWMRSDPEDGKYRLTNVAEAVFPGVPVDLREEHTARPLVRVQVTGLDAWKAHAPFRFQVRCSTDNVLVEDVRLDAEGRGTLPPLPARNTTFVVTAKSGVTLVEHRVPDTPAEQKVAVPPPERVTVSVRDVHTKKGVPGARILARHDTHLAPIGRTEADGVAVLELPSKTRYSKLAADAAAYAPAALEKGSGEAAGKWPALRDGVTPAQFCRIGPGFRATGRFTVGGAAAPDTAVFVEGSTMHYDDTNSRTLSSYKDVLRAGADGTFVVPASLHEFPPLFHAVLGDATIAALPEAWRRGLHPLVVDILRSEKSKGDYDAGTLDLRTFCPVDFRVLADDGAPLDRATITLGPVRKSSFVAKATRFRTDRRGRLRLLLPPERHLLVTAAGTASWAVHEVRAKSGKEAENIVSCVIRTAPGIALSGRVIDAAGKAVAGMSLSASMRRATATKVGSKAETPDAGAGQNRLVLLKNRTPDQVVSRFMLLRRSMRTTTDEQGRFSVAMPNFSGQVRFSGYTRGKGKRLRVRETVPVDGAAPADLVLTAK